jgi:cysteinyl-tRNA synthetase
MDFEATISANIGQRVSIRLFEPDGGFRDILGILQSDTTLIDKRGEARTFEIEKIAFLRIVPE